MQRDTTKQYYALHSWVGVVTAVMLFVIAFTGAVSVFSRGELKVWANQDIRSYTDHDFVAIENLIRDHAAAVAPAFYDHVQVFFPGPHGGRALSIIFEDEVVTQAGGHTHRAIWFRHHPQTLALLSRQEGDLNQLFAQSDSDMADFLVTFHADLHLGSPLGLILTGLLGLTLLASVITGILIHPKILKELFNFRPWRSMRLLFTDTHKVLGVWGLLFHGTIGFTGAILGLVTVVLIPAAAFVSFNGDQEKLLETFLPEVEPALTGQPAEPQLASTLQEFSEKNPGVIVGNVVIYGWGDKGSVMTVSTLGDRLNARTYEYSTATGELIRDYTLFSRLDGSVKVVLDAMYPLHFGNFGGIAVKFIWFFLGLSTALLAATGMMVWIERRAYGAEGKLSLTTYNRISKFTAGVCGGLIVATLSLFHAQLLLPMMANTIGFWLGVVFFGVWVACGIGAMLRPNAYLATRDLMLLAAITALLVIPVNGVVTGDWIINSLLSGDFIVAGVDAFVLATGALLAWSAFNLPAQRPVRQKSSQQESRHAPVASDPDAEVTGLTGDCS